MTKRYRTGLWPELPKGITIIKFFPAIPKSRGDEPFYRLQFKVFNTDQTENRTFNFDRDTYEERFSEATAAHFEMRVGDGETISYKLPEWRKVLQRLDVKQVIEKRYRYVDK